MNTLMLSLLLTLLVGPIPASQAGKKAHPTKLARYQMGAYLAASGTKLRVNVNKQLGGQVAIHLLDQRGKSYFEQTLAPLDTLVRLSLDLSELDEGKYVLKVSNGLDIMLRDITISPVKPTITTRSVTVQ